MRTLWAKDEEKAGCGTCPDCKKVLGYGPGGLVNLHKTHRFKKVCVDEKERLEKAAATAAKSRTMFNFFQKKLPSVPSTVQAPDPVLPSSSASAPLASIPAIITGKSSATPSTSPIPPPVRSESYRRLKKLIRQLLDAARRLPLSIPEADDTNPLAVFSADPASYLEANVNPAEIWQLLSSNFHKAFGYGEGPETRERMIETGPYGLGGFCRFLDYFVDRGMEGGMVELKVEQVQEALNAV